MTEEEFMNMIRRVISEPSFAEAYAAVLILLRRNEDGGFSSRSHGFFAREELLPIMEECLGAVYDMPNLIDAGEQKKLS
jgi:hypothetical protein